jgi:hypothetical protein
MILGRGAEDSKQVMSALVSPFDRQIIWHIQGFLSEQCPVCNLGSAREDAQLLRLRDELVVGHSEYRQATFTAVHFRRCFGELFESRSFLFLGSGLSEEYFRNLFSETLELRGPSSVPHFAFLPAQHGVDSRFLAEEMNIHVCEYEDHAQLVPWLRMLRAAIDSPRALISRLHVQMENSFSLEIARQSALPAPDPGSGRAVAVMVEPSEDGRIEFDPSLGHLGYLQARFNDHVFFSDEHVLTLEAGLFAFRKGTSSDHGSPHDGLSVAVLELLDRVAGFIRDIHVSIPSAVGTVSSVYNFVEVVRTFGSWVEEKVRDAILRQSDARQPLNLIVHVGPGVLLNVNARKIDLVELLTSPLCRFSIVANDENGEEAARLVLYRRPSTRFGDVLIEALGELDEVALHRWSISIYPNPGQTIGLRADAVAMQTLHDVGIVTGSVMILVRT